MNPINLLNTNFYDAILMNSANKNKKITELEIDNDILQRVDDILQGYTKKNKKPMNQKLQKLQKLGKNKKQQIHIEDARVRNSFSFRKKSFTRDYETERYKRDFKNPTRTKHETSQNHTTEIEESESSSEEVVYI